MNTLDSVSGHLQQLMNAAQLRHEVTSHNLANINTPGYHAQTVDFEDQLAQQLANGAQSGSQKTGSPLTPQVSETVGLPARADGNNVDMDREVGTLQKNALLFQTYSEVLSSRLSMMQRAIRLP